jgi:hypothetical protein
LGSGGVNLYEPLGQRVPDERFRATLAAAGGKADKNLARRSVHSSNEVFQVVFELTDVGNSPVPAGLTVATLSSTYTT